MRPKKPSGFARGFAAFVHRIMGSAAVGLVHGRPDKRAILVDLVHASGTTHGELDHLVIIPLR
jgi:hypothetical protein